MSDQERDLKVGGDGEPEPPRGIDRLNLEIERSIKRQAELDAIKRAAREARKKRLQAKQGESEPVAEAQAEREIDLRDPAPPDAPARETKVAASVQTEPEPQVEIDLRDTAAAEAPAPPKKPPARHRRKKKAPTPPPKKAPSAAPQEEPASGPKLKPQRRRRGWLRYLVALLLIGFVALMAEVVYVGLGLRSRMLSAETSLTSARSEIENGDYITAGNMFEQALDDARRAEDLVDRPGGWALRTVPFTSTDARTVEVLIDVTDLLSRAGLDAVDLFDRLAVSSEGFAGSFYRAGRFRLQPMGIAHEGVKGVLDLVSQAESLLQEDLDPSVPEIGDALATARSQVSETLARLERADVLLSTTPSLLGQGRGRHYLFVLQDPAQSRSSGGVIRYYGVLSATEGQLRLGRVRPIRKFTGRSGVGVRHFNLSPHFPTVAQWLLRYFEERTDRRLDGVIASDPVALQNVLEVTGPVRERGYNVAVNSHNAGQVLMHDAVEYFEGRTADRDRWVAAIVEKAWKTITRNVGETSVLLDALNTSSRTQHLKVYTNSADAQRALDDLGVTGDVSVFGSNAQLVTQNSRIASQVDFFLRRRVETRVTLEADGSAQVTTSVRIENRAPDGPPSSVLGFEHTGLARLSLEAVLPQNAENIMMLPERTKGSFRRGAVEQRPLLSIDMSIPPDSVSSSSFSYVVPEAVGENDSFNFTLISPSLAFPDEAELRVDAAEGTCFAPCGLVESSRWIRRGTLETPWRVSVKIMPIPD